MKLSIDRKADALHLALDEGPVADLLEGQINLNNESNIFNFL
jgi:hypothetical protein